MSYFILSKLSPHKLLLNIGLLTFSSMPSNELKVTLSSALGVDRCLQILAINLMF